MNKQVLIGVGAIVGLVVAAVLAFGVFGIQTAFIDDEVSEDNPFANVDTEMAERFDDMETRMADGEIEVVERDVTTPAEAEPMMVDAAGTDDAGSAGDEGNRTDDDVEVGADVESEDGQAAADQAGVVRTIATNDGELIDHAHVGQGTVNVLTDGNQTFLRFEDDFAIDNGPDLNVYLVRGVDADGPPGEFDDDFVDLGDLKGNIGAQNYEVPQSVDLEEYDTVVIWCVRFGVAFNAADLN